MATFSSKEEPMGMTGRECPASPRMSKVTGFGFIISRDVERFEGRVS